MFAAVSQIIVPLAATLAAPSRRGQTVGVVTGAILIGILSARTIGGLVGGAFGWRTVYRLAGATLLLLALLMRVLLPRSRPAATIRYRELLRSLWTLLRDVPELRRCAVLAALTFAAANTFWNTLIFFIAEPPYHYGATQMDSWPWRVWRAHYPHQ